jgi:hypothetical protein
VATMPPAGRSSSKPPGKLASGLVAMKARL